MADAMAKAQPIVCGDYLVKAGDCLTSIAASSGHLWTTIWNHPNNAELKRARDPNILLPGDRVFVPPRQPRTEQAATENTHTFVKKSAQGMLRIVAMDMNEPLASQPYVLTVGGTTIQGTTDAQGRIEQSIPPGSSKGHLIVGTQPDALEYDFLLGTLDPPNSVSGVQARLTNLGYDPGPVDGIQGPRTNGAIEDFCAANNIDPPEKGQLSSDFCDQLSQVHGF